MPADAVLLGEKALRRRLGHLEKRASRGAIRSGLGAGMQVMVKEVRRQVNATSIDTPHATSLKRGARRAVGKRFEKRRAGQDLRGVVGFAVGRKGGRRSETLSSGLTEGVHVAAANIHWFVLGARIFGRYWMLGQFEDCVPNAVAASGEPAMNAAVQKSKQRILKEARKR